MLARDIWLVFHRQFTLMLRNPAWLVVGAIQPVFYLLLFAPLLRPALGASSSAEAYRVFVPGLLVLLALFASLFAGLSIIAEARAGVLERCRVTPVRRVALLMGRSLRDVVTLLIQATIIVVLALPFGLRVAVVNLLVAYAVLAAMTLALSAASYGVALGVANESAMSPLLQTISMPLLLLSGVLLPLSYAPGWLQAIAAWNPFAYVVDAQRAIFAGDLQDASVWQGSVLLVAMTAVALAWSARAFGRGMR